jgi:hypothetical protein
MEYSFQLPTTDGESQYIDVDFFGGLDDDGANSLRYCLACYRNRIPKELIWITSDPFGNAICLGVFGDARGKVYWWDHDNEMIGGYGTYWDGSLAESDNVELLADSFADFVAGLTDSVDDGEFDVEISEWKPDWLGWACFLPMLVLTLLTCSTFAVFLVCAHLIARIRHGMRKLAQMFSRNS